MRPFCERSVNCACLSPPLSSSGPHSSDSDGHFDTPEEATPVHGPRTFPGELEESSAGPDKAGEATVEQAECRKSRESGQGGNKTAVPSLTDCICPSEKCGVLL